MMPLAFFSRLDPIVDRLERAHARKTDEEAEEAFAAFEARLLAQWRENLPLPAGEVTEIVADIMQRLRKQRRDMRERNTAIAADLRERRAASSS